MDRNSFQEIYTRYSEELFNYCLKYCKDDHRAEEIVQDIFLSLWERLDTFFIDGDIKRYPLPQYVEWIVRQEL